MLTGYQVTVVAYDTEHGELLCPDCAVKQFGALTVSKAERGLETSAPIRPVSRYGLEEYEVYDEETGDVYESASCEECGEEIG